MKNRNQKTILLVAFLVMAGQILTVQAQKLTQGEPYKMTTKDRYWADIEPVGSDESGAYYLLYPFSKLYSGFYIGSKDTYIGKVSNDKDLEAFETINLTYKEKALNLQFGLELNKVTYLFASFENNDLQKSFLFAQTLNRKTLKPNNDWVKISEIDYSSENKYKYMSYDYVLSPDESKVLLSHNMLDKDGTLLSFGLTITDNKLDIIDHLSAINLPDEGIYSVQEYKVSNKGKAYMLAEYYDRKKEYKNSASTEKQGFLSRTSSLKIEANYKLKIFEFQKGSITPKVLNVKVADHFVTNLSMYTKEEGGLVIMGFYSSNDDFLPEGTFVQSVNESLKVVNTDIRDLKGQFDQPSKYVNDTYVAPGLLKKRDDLTNYQFSTKDILKTSNGDYVLSAERVTKLFKTEGNQQTGFSTVTIYHTDDIAVIAADNQGKIKYVSKVEKAQETAELKTLYSSFVVTEQNEKIQLIFTDISNQNIKGLMGKIVDTECSLVKIASDGSQSKKILFTSSKDHLTMMADDTFVTKEGEVILYGNVDLRSVGFIGLDF